MNGDVGGNGSGDNVVAFSDGERTVIRAGVPALAELMAAETDLEAVADQLGEFGVRISMLGNQDGTQLPHEEFVLERPSRDIPADYYATDEEPDPNIAA